MAYDYAERLAKGVYECQVHIKFAKVAQEPFTYSYMVSFYCNNHLHEKMLFTNKIFTLLCWVIFHSRFYALIFRK